MLKKISYCHSRSHRHLHERMARRLGSTFALRTNIMIRTSLTLPPNTLQWIHATSITHNTLMPIQLRMHFLPEHGTYGVLSKAKDIRAVDVSRNVGCHLGDRFRSFSSFSKRSHKHTHCNRTRVEDCNYSYRTSLCGNKGSRENTRSTMATPTTRSCRC